MPLQSSCFQAAISVYYCNNWGCYPKTEAGARSDAQGCSSATLRKRSHDQKLGIKSQRSFSGFSTPSSRVYRTCPCEVSLPLLQRLKGRRGFFGITKKRLAKMFTVDEHTVSTREDPNQSTTKLNVAKILKFLRSK